MTDENFLTKHPEEGKQGVNISKAKYDVVRDAIIAILNEQEIITWQALPGEVEARLPDGWSGSVPWYTISVKLDLEARGILERVPGRSPQEIRLISGRVIAQ